MTAEPFQSSKLNLVERIGLGVLRGRIERTESDVHRWSDEELARIRVIERWTIGFAALGGAVSGAIIGSLEIALSGWLLAEVEGGEWRQQIPYWSSYLATAALVSGAEVVFLYWIALRCVARITSIAGLSLSVEEIEQMMAVGLSRAALGLPNPRSPVYGVDPHAQAVRWKLLLYTLFYKLKVGITSFIFRILLRRVLARAALRSAIPLVAIPVYAMWNGMINLWVLREVRIRAAAPLAMKELGEWVRERREVAGEEARRLILEAVGESVIRAQDAHPNLVLLLTSLFHDLELPRESIDVDWDRARRRLADLESGEQDLLLTVLAVATVLNGRPRKAQRRLLLEACETCGRSLDDEALAGLRSGFIDGQGLSREHLESLASQPLSSREAAAVGDG